jgi:hypothetical protein
MIKMLWRIVIGLVYALIIYGLAMGALSVYVYIIDYNPTFFGGYMVDESMLDFYLGDSWKYWTRGKHWLAERQIWVETSSLLIGVIGSLLGRFPLTGKS